MSNSMTKTDYRTFLAERGVKTTTRTPLAELRRLYAEALTAPAAEATPKHSVSIITDAYGSVHGHKAGCADVAKMVKKQHLDGEWTMEVATKHDAWLEYNADFLAEGSGAWGIDWKACANDVPQGEADVDVESPDHNCVLPTPEEPVEEPESADAEAAAEFTAEPVEQAEDAPFAADAIKDWRGNYNTVFAPAAELIAAQRKGVVARTESVSVMLKETHIAGVNSQDLLDELVALEEASTAALRAWQKTQDRKGMTDMEKFNQNRSFLAGYCAAATGSKKLPTIAFAKDMAKALRADAHAAGAAARKAAK